MLTLFAGFLYANIFLILIFQIVYLFTTYYKAFLFIYSIKFRSKKENQKIEPKALPSFNILMANYKEKKETIQQLIQNVEAIEYPKQLIKGFLIIQEDDEVLKTLSSIDLPEYIELLVIPTVQEGQVQSKSRALNYAIQLCENDIITLFDSEDEPDPLQFLKVAKRFEERDEDVIQCTIGIYNVNQNFLSRFFAAEFRCFFEYLLDGIDNLSFLKLYPYLPLGGTSFYIKNQMMKKIGKFDMFNPTEDLILSASVYLHGGKIGHLNSVTEGEAPVKFKQLINQRTRWVKGFMISSIVLNRDVLKSIKNIGFIRWSTFNAWTLGSIFSLGFPLFMFISIVYLSTDYDLIKDLLPTWMWIIGFGGLFVLGSIINIALFVIPALKKKRTADVFLTPLFIIFSNIILAISAYKALYQLVFKPNMAWSKTEHGLAVKDNK